MDACLLAYLLSYVRACFGLSVVPHSLPLGSALLRLARTRQAVATPCRRYSRHSARCLRPKAIESCRCWSSRRPRHGAVSLYGV
ncbi:hypothetical protein PF008_g33165 [Phytophthora fragariae]|uniref:Secreted protein n=1 Tax=Phytophthora fragariae TaxID=53985 RepID=A0A6G0PY88_9STRA|nr:hypothetical protein PF008_g33165 [Phytophthora fragariae]